MPKKMIIGTMLIIGCVHLLEVEYKFSVNNCNCNNGVCSKTLLKLIKKA